MQIIVEWPLSCAMVENTHQKVCCAPSATNVLSPVVGDAIELRPSQASAYLRYTTCRRKGKRKRHDNIWHVVENDDNVTHLNLQIRAHYVRTPRLWKGLSKAISPTWKWHASTHYHCHSLASKSQTISFHCREQFIELLTIHSTTPYGARGTLGNSGHSWQWRASRGAAPHRHTKTDLR
jgi:hypothetical protein